MSREERRQYERMMRNMDRGPALPPAARARAERNARRRERTRQTGTTAPQEAITRRFVTRAILIALVVGFLAFSSQWGEGMPFAIYVGLGVAALTFLVAVGFRMLQRRATAP